MLFRLIRKHFSENKVVFSLFALCQIVSLLVCLFVFNLMSIREINSANDSVYRTVIIGVSDSDARYGAQIEQLLGDDIISNIETVEARVARDGDTVSVILHHDSRYSDVIDAGRDFTAEEIGQRAAVAVMNPLRTSAAVGDTVEIMGREYTVVGLCSRLTDPKVTAYGDIISEIGNITVVYKVGLGAKDADRVVSRLDELFAGSVVLRADKAQISVFEFGIEDVLIILALVIVNINFLTMYYYIFDRDVATYAIFKMCGCSPRRSAAIIYGEVVIISAASFILSVLLFAVLGTPIFHFMNPLINYTFSVKATLRALLAYAVAMAVILVPMLGRLRSRKTYRTYNKEVNL